MTRMVTIDKPGDLIQAELDERGWEAGDLAFVLGLDIAVVKRLIAGKKRITPDLSVALGDAFGMPSDVFLGAQSVYDLKNASLADPGIRKRAFWAKFPVREMINRGWIKDVGPDALDHEMLKFFCVDCIEDVPFIGDTEKRELPW